jgi:hypothetical protein
MVLAGVEDLLRLVKKVALLVIQVGVAETV